MDDFIVTVKAQLDNDSLDQIQKDLNSKAFKINKISIDNSALDTSDLQKKLDSLKINNLSVDFKELKKKLVNRKDLGITISKYSFEKGLLDNLRKDLKGRNFTVGVSKLQLQNGAWNDFKKYLNGKDLKIKVKLDPDLNYLKKALKGIATFNNSSGKGNNNQNKNNTTSDNFDLKKARLEQQIEKLFESFNSSIDKTTKKTSDLESKINDLRTNIQNATTDKDLSKISIELGEANARLGVYKQNVKNSADETNVLFEQSQRKLTETIKVAMSNLAKNYDTTKQEVDTINKAMEKLLSDVNNTTSTAGLTYINKELSILKQQLSQIEKIKKSSNNQNTNNGNGTSQEAFLQKRANLLRQILNFTEKNTKSTRKYGEVFEELERNVRNATDPEQLKVFTSQFAQLRTSLTQTSDIGKKFSDRIKDGFKNLFETMTIADAIYRFVSQVKQAISTIEDLDSAMIELRKVSEATEESYDNFYYTSNDIAISLGQTTQAVIEQTAAWAQLGYALDDAITMAKTSSIFATISPEMSTDDATSTLISTMKAYGIEAEDALDGIASKINIVGNNFASSNSDIATMLQKSSAAMASANNSLEETIALGMAANEIVQNADVTGTAQKTKFFKKLSLCTEMCI